MKQKKSVQEALSIEYSPELFKEKYIYSFFKRLFDILSSLVSLIILLPLLLIIGVLIKLDSKGPVFYGHKRIGKNGNEFIVWKFRSMVADQKPLEEILTLEQMDEWKKNYKIDNDPRITKIGSFLRKTSLDELPQLWNIFIGDMSVVSWRPIIREELKMYSSKEQSLLLKIKPGLTGFWACHGRSDTKYEDRIKMELYYVYKRNFWLDFRILWNTLLSVFSHRGAK